MKFKQGDRVRDKHLNREGVVVRTNQFTGAVWVIFGTEYEYDADNLESVETKK